MKKKPLDEVDLAYSLALTDHYFAPTVLRQISSDMLAGKPRPQLSPEQELQFREAARAAAPMFLGRAEKAERSNNKPQHRVRTTITGAIRWTGYLLIGVGLILFAATYIATFMREGTAAVLARFSNPIYDAFLIVLCVGPGLLMLGWAESRKNKSNPTSS